MSNGTPKKHLLREVDARKLAVKGVDLGGDIPLSQLERLSELVNTASIMANLSFDIDEQGRRYVKGSAKVRLALECQRCLEPVDQELNVDFLLAFAFTEEQAQGLPKLYEAWMIEEDLPTDLYYMVEEEILLSLPVVAYHDDEQCIQRLAYNRPEASAEMDEPKDNPFNVLEKLKR